jgi:hypothetical protein
MSVFHFRGLDDSLPNFGPKTRTGKNSWVHPSLRKTIAKDDVSEPVPRASKSTRFRDYPLRTRAVPAANLPTPNQPADSHVTSELVMHVVSPSEQFADRVRKGEVSFVDLTADDDEVTSPKPIGTAGAGRLGKKR